MGTWGYGIFEDDTASDVRAEFEEALGEGLDANAATQRVFENLGDAIEDYDEDFVFWLSLAAVQLDHGVLQEEIRQRALASMTLDLKRWHEAGPSEAAQRKRALDDLRVRLEGAA